MQIFASKQIESRLHKQIFRQQLSELSLLHGVVGDKNRTNLCLIIADKNVIEKTRRVLRKKERSKWELIFYSPAFALSQS